VVNLFSTSDKQLNKLLILDLDETLIHGRSEPLQRPADMILGDLHIYFRPHVSHFISVLSNYYEMAIWSSASEEYVEAVADRLFGSPNNLRFLWSHGRCTQRLNPETGDTIYLKDLKKVKRNGFTLNRVIILEDEPIKVSRNYGNAVYVRPFFGQEDDSELLELEAFLVNVSAEEDFRKIDKRFKRRSDRQWSE
jgi:TFIIF-interacting CTD phosphatase-like protein